MQKKIIALAIAGLASSAAFAQSNVTVYGVADVYYGHFNNAGQRGLTGINSGGLSGSRIGLKGTEDLGNGLKAIFTLEYALAVDDNTGIGTGTTAGRQQFVGLTGGFGTAVAGRLQTAGYDWACAYNPLGGSALDAQTIVGGASTANPGNFTLLTCGTNGRANNAVAYISPSFGGVTLAVNHARVSETQNATTYNSGSQTNNDYANLASVSYANGPIAAGLVYSKVLVRSTAAADSLQEIGLGASYDFQVVKLFANFQTADLNTAGVAGNRNNKFQVSAAVPVTAKATLVLQGAKSNIKNTAADDDSRAYTLAGTYAVSKRTTAYAGYTRVVNEAAAARVVAGADATGITGAASSGLALGLRHTF
jgi:predicted porin